MKTILKTTLLAALGSAALTWPMPASGDNADLRWTGASSAVWDVGTSTNWLNTATTTPDIFRQLDRVLFDDTAGGQTNITLATTVTPASVTVNVTTENITFSGSGRISGAGGITKLGTGMLTINTTNDFTGPVVLSGGTLYAGNDMALGAVPVAVTLGSIVLNGGELYVPTLITVNSNRGVVLGAIGGTLSFVGGTSYYEGAISGVGGLVLNLVNSSLAEGFGGASTYTGGTSLKGVGMVAVRSSSVGMAGNPTSGPFGAGSAPLILNGAQIRASTGGAQTVGNPVTVASNTILPTVANEKSLTFSGPVTLGGGSKILTVNVGATVAGTIVEFSGAVGDGGNPAGLTKAGTGLLKLSGANTYSGDTVVSGGTLLAGGANAIPSGTGKGLLQINSGSTFDMTNNNLTVNTITGSGVIQCSGGVRVLTVGGTGLSSVFSGRLGLGGSGYPTILKQGSGTLTIGGTGDNVFAGAIVNSGILVLGKTSTSGVHALGSPNDALVINASGLAQLGGTGGDQIAYDRNVLLNGGTFDLNGRNEAFNILHGSSGTVLNSAASTISTLTVGANNGSGSFSGTLQDGAGSLSLIKVGTGVAMLTGANSYSGGTSVKAGVLTINSGLTGGSCLVATNAVLAGNGAISGNITVNGSLQPGDSSIGAGVLTVSNLVMNAGAIFGFHYSGTPNLAGAFTDQLTVMGDLVLNSNSVAMTLLGTNPPSPGTYRLINYSGAKIGSFGSVIHSTRYTLMLDESITNQINLVVGDSGTPLVPFYFNPFEGAVGTEWSQTTKSITPKGSSSYLGQFGPQTVTLNLAKLPPHAAGLLSFDLYIINTWDGNDTYYGPDRWSVQVSNGPVLIDTTFSDCSGENQAFPSWYGLGNFIRGNGAYGTNSLGYPPYGSGYFGDTVYHMEFGFQDVNTNLTLSFRKIGAGNSGDASDEGWGLKNMKVFLDSQSGESWPMIVTQPQSQTVSPGTNITFNVAAIGNPGVTYQWALNGVNIADATNTWLSITNVQRANSGTYTVKARNPFGSAISVDAYLAVIEALPSGIVSWWPANGNSLDIIGGRNAYLQSGVSYGAGEVGNAFAFDGTTNAWAFTAGDLLTNIQNTFTMEFWALPSASRAATTEGIAGIYGGSNQRYAIMPNHGGFAGPAGAGVSVGTNGISVFELADNYMPSVLVYNTTLMSWTHVAVVYQNKQSKLYLNGVLVRTGLTSTRSSIFPSKTFGGEGLTSGPYKGLLDEVTIYNRALAQPEIAAIYAAGSAGKSQPPNNLVAQPQGQTVRPGQDASFSVTAAGEPPLQYQWLKNGVPISQANSPALQLSDVSSNDMARYTVIVTNAYGMVTSAPVALAVSAPLDLTWLQQLGGTNDDSGGFITMDASGSVFVAGEFSGSIDLSGTNLTSDDLSDLYIAKYSNAGKLLWAVQAGSSTNGSVYPEAIQIGANGDILLTGQFTGGARFGDTNLIPQGGYDMFVAKYDRKGQLVWVTQAGGTNSDLGTAIATDAAGNVFVTGWFQSTAAFGTTNLVSHGSDDSFLAKYDPAGNLCWLKDIGGTNLDRSTGLAINSSGEVILCGEFSGTADFGGIILAAQNWDVFLTKYDTQGNLLWARNFGGPDREEAQGVALDSSGNILLTGLFYSAVADFGGIGLTNSGAADLFVCKYDPAGQLIWANRAGGYSYDVPNSMVVDQAGNCYVSGYFMDVADFDTTLLVSGGSWDAFVAKWNAAGQFAWAKGWGGTGDQYGYGGMALDSANNIYAATVFYASAQIGDTNLVSRGNFDLAIAKIGNAPVQPLITLPGEGPTITPAGLRFQLDSVPAQGSVIMEASTDLGTWLPISTNTAAGIPLDLVLPADGQAHRFYRVRVEP